MRGEKGVKPHNTRGEKSTAGDVGHPCPSHLKGRMEKRGKRTQETASRPKERRTLYTPIPTTGKILGRGGGKRSGNVKLQKGEKKGCA